MKRVLVILASAICLSFCSSSAVAQSCLTKEDVTRLIQRINQPQPQKPDKKLENELVKLATATQEKLQDYVKQEKKTDSLRKRVSSQNEKATAKLCQVLKDVGWPTKGLVEEAGVQSAFYLLKTSAPYELQRDLLPVIVAAVKQDESQKPEFAGVLDRLRVGAGMKQLFGTQAIIRNGFLVLYPIEDEAHVDERRAQFGLRPMAEHLRTLERQYQTPVVKSRDIPPSQLSSGLKQSISGAIQSTLLNTPPISEGDVIRTDTNLVNLNVSVFSNKLKIFVSALTKDDFKVFEDGKEQTVSYFASTEVPFDLVLLVDLSGSTERKRDLIRQSTQRFIEAARPADRISIVTFSDKVNVLSPLTSDRTRLLESITDMTGGGGSSIWDALKFSLDNIVGQKSLERRRAIVMMTDGVDGALSYFHDDFGSQISFADLLEAVRQTDTLIVPIYLDTESDDSPSSWTRQMYENARKTLGALAEESGGTYYKAKKIADLNGVYEQVINDLGKVYSLGYKPENDKRDGTWRSVQVQIVNRPDLIARSRPGYYAK